jgi:hypothetical protein
MAFVILKDEARTVAVEERLFDAVIETVEVAVGSGEGRGHEDQPEENEAGKEQPGTHMDTPIDR